MPWILACILTAFGACLLCLACTPLVRRLALRLDFVDRPRSQGHKLHAKVTPQLGGLAIYLALFATIASTCLLAKYQAPWLPSDFPDIFSQGNTAIARLWPLALSATGFLILGALDDRWPLSAKVKLLVQIGLSLFASAMSMKIDAISSPLASTLLCTLWLLVVMNSINILDNMDGLCCGIVGICSLFLTAIALLKDQHLVCLFCAAITGACLGFYCFNANPASIFLGDAGSHLLAHLLGLETILVTYSDGSIAQSSLPFLLPFLIMAIPLFDMAAVIAIRTSQGKPIHIGDHNHISHRFVRMGFSRRTAVLMIHLLTAMTCCAAVAILTAAPAQLPWVCLPTILLLIFIAILHHRHKPQLASPPPASSAAPTPPPPPQAQPAGPHP